MLESITPVILTLNEEPNIARTLGQLRWARRVVVVDSFSSDRTLEIARSFANSEVFHRQFDLHSAQWNYAIGNTGIDTHWILALDADYFLPDTLIAEIEALAPAEDIAGFRARFRMCSYGRVLRSSIYPPVTILYRSGSGRYVQDGHTQRLAIEGTVAELRNRALHDDRKSVSVWFEAQRRYSQLEAKKLRAAPFGSLNWHDRVRKCRILAPFVMFFYCFFVRLGILDGLPGISYAFRRTTAELMLSLCMFEDDFKI